MTFDNQNRYAGSANSRETEFCRPYGWRDERNAERDAKWKVGRMEVALVPVILEKPSFEEKTRFIRENVGSFDH
jgi:hypothetical protein